ncbi:MAG: helix-turn-helix transcriptional regulator [Treponema sp.]|nr:helix-turn-helix transcriptional regulator [Treponema sp.]
MRENKRIFLEGQEVNLQFDDSQGKNLFPDLLGSINIDARKEHSNILYRSWNLQFGKSIKAEEPDNAGRDEVQLMFTLNQDIKWYIRHKAKGKEIIRADEEIEMARGEVCVFRNNDLQTGMSYAANTNFKFKSMQMPTSFFRQLLSKYFSDRDIHELESQFLTHVTKTTITGEMYKILSEIDTSERFKEYEGVYLEGKMIELTALVLYGIAYNRTAKIKRKSLPNNTDIERIEFLREQIQRKPAEDYDAVSVAQNLGMSISKLNRNFRTLYGTSLHAYVQDKRLEYAAHLIREHNFSVSEAAQKSGYNNMSHFSLAFSKKFGILPKDFSKQKLAGGKQNVVHG